MAIQTDSLAGAIHWCLACFLPRGETPPSPYLQRMVLDGQQRAERLLLPLMLCLPLAADGRQRLAHQLLGWTGMVLGGEGLVSPG